MHELVAVALPAVAGLDAAAEEAAPTGFSMHELNRPSCSASGAGVVCCCCLSVGLTAS